MVGREVGEGGRLGKWGQEGGRGRRVSWGGR